MYHRKNFLFAYIPKNNTIFMSNVYDMDEYKWASEIGVYDKNNGLAAKVCEGLLQGLLNEGRTLYVNNFNTFQ